MNIHEQEEADFGRGPVLWDADPDVCCAAFQLGACAHTEDFDYDELTPEVIVMPAAEFDAFLAMLDMPVKESVKLARLLARPQRITSTSTDDNEPF